MRSLRHVLSDEIPKCRQVIRSTAREQILSWHKLHKVQRLAVDLTKFFQLVAVLVTQPWQKVAFVERANNLIVEE